MSLYQQLINCHIRIFSSKRCALAGEKYMQHSTYWVILAICWGAVGLTWVIGWIYNVWKAHTVQRRTTFLPLWILGIALVWLVASLFRHNVLAFMTFTAPWLQIVGSIILIGATAFTLWARWVLGTMWAAVAEIKEGHQLRTEGPYRITRHPIYTGLMGMVLGSMFLSGFGVWVLCFIVGLAAVIIKISSEERLLKETFGEEYTSYQHHVPQLIPGKQLITRE
jgi:protein-S-isoprenylcysteine O-methyltransferase Ste14